MSEVAYFAGGCFWGVEHAFLSSFGNSIRTTVGYMGDPHVSNPSYHDIPGTNHAEVLRVEFDAERGPSFRELAKHFFNTHNPTELNRQGPDIGPQYRSEIFVLSEEQRETCNDLIRQLEKHGLRIATKVTDGRELTFWKAEEYHQKYYQKSGKTPYCHVFNKLL